VASTNSLRTGAYKVEVLRRSHHVCKSRLQLFDIALQIRGNVCGMSSNQGGGRGRGVFIG
jgi:hypothetical protein